jgi:PIN domain
MSTKIYIVLDTNILVHYVTLGKAGCDEASWNDLQELGKRSDVTFLVPEVIALEMKKFNAKGMTDDLERSFKLISAGIGKLFVKSNPKNERVWNEVDNVEPDLKAMVEELKTKRLSGLPDRLQQVERWLKSRKVTKIPFDNDVMLRTKKRMIAGQYPTSTDTNSEGKLAENDAYIIDSLVYYFEGKTSPANQLLFCTENLKDFGLVVAEKDVVLIHPTLQQGLPAPSFILETIGEAVSFVQKHEKAELPDKKDVQQALLDEQKLHDTKKLRDLTRDLQLGIAQFARPTLTPEELRELVAAQIARPTLTPEELRELVAAQIARRALTREEMRELLFGYQVAPPTLTQEEIRELFAAQVHRPLLTTEQRRKLQESQKGDVDVPKADESKSDNMEGKEIKP